MWFALEASNLVCERTQQIALDCTYFILCLSLSGDPKGIKIVPPKTGFLLLSQLAWDFPLMLGLH